VALHFKKIALKKAVNVLTFTLVATATAIVATGQTAAPFFLCAVLVNLTALAGTIYALGKIPANV